jgi:3-phosphoshikimate 1-carboxyvinyltransferase
MPEVAMSRSITVKGRGAVSGALTVPGDKSISHRVALLASVARGASRIKGFASSADCAATLDCIKRLGIAVERSGDELVIDGRGLYGYLPARSAAELYAGNSGSTMRMMSGLLAAQSFKSVIDGDESLRRRPMRRIIEPLALMGARIEAREGGLAPLEITGGRLKPIEYESLVASAQVKSCVLLAGLYARGRTVFTEPLPTRDHTELMLKEFGAHITTSGARRARISIEGGAELNAVDYRVPGDPSSAAFFLAAATVLPGSNLRISGVNLNPTRTAFIDVLKSLGAKIATENHRTAHGEPVGDLVASASKLESASGGTLLAGEIIPALIDEIPILAVIATQARGRTEVRGAKELRVKESDRLRTVVDGLRAMGAQVEEFDDGFALAGPQYLTGARVETAGDHRIAMAFAIAGLIATGATEIIDSDCVAVSFPEFYDLLRRVAVEGVIE